MARRQLKLTTPLSVPDSTGTATSYDLVRVRSFYIAPVDHRILVDWEIGRLDAGTSGTAPYTWSPSTIATSQLEYDAAAYDALLGGTSTVESVADQFFQDLIDQGLVGAGVLETWPEDLP